jgi:Mrp family chromosome partitioning ATPase
VQIDNGSAPATGVVTIEAPGADANQIRRYLRAVKRRWPILIAFAFVGALLGWVTTPDAQGALVADKTFYQATNTLILDSGSPAGSESGSRDASINLEQAAFLANKGEVSVRVAEKLGLDPAQVSSNVIAQALGGVSSIQVTAIGSTPDATVTLSDTTATELAQYLSDSATQSYQAQRDDVLKKLDEIKAQQADLQGQIVRNSSPELQAQLDSTVNQYRTTYEQFQQLAAQGQPGAGLKTIQAATPIAISRADYNAIRSQIVATPELTASAATPATTTAPRSTSASSKPPSPGLRAIAGGILGLILGLVLAMVLDRYDSRLRQREDVEAATNLPVLAEIPPLTKEQQHSTEIVALTNRRSRAAEAYRVVRTALIFAHMAGDEQATPFAVGPPSNGSPGKNGSNRDNGSNGSNGSSRKRALGTNAGAVAGGPLNGQVIMVTSPGPDEGKTTTVANLAAVLAEGGSSVLVINCDFRRPRIGKYLLEGETADALADQMGDIAATGQVKAVGTRIPRVRLVTGIGEGDHDANPIEIVGVQRRLIGFARQHYDVVLLDTAPFLTTNDASDLLVDTDTVLMVARCGKTRRESARRAGELLGRLEAPVLGVIFTDSADAPSTDYYYHYYLDESAPKSRLGRAAKVGDDGPGEPGSLADLAVGAGPVEAPRN